MLTVAGLVPFTTIDFPQHLAAVVFFKGCPLRCPFCHNPNLQDSTGPGDSTWDETLAFLKGRTKRLDGVVLSGGEPLMQPEIATAVQQLKELGFKVAIHTSGVYPEKLATILPHIDWVGLDIKAPWHKYETLTGRPHMAERVQETLRLLLESGVAFETRTTCDPNHLTVADVLDVARDMQSAGVKTYAMQKYRTFPEDKNPPSQSAIDSFFEDSEIREFCNSAFNTYIVR